ncbi:MAG TPA: LPD7 domain-containing protein [Sulfuriferula sp.]|nr:LPD7 domain-containing protein [Sulfuriferula sp.]
MQDMQTRHRDERAALAKAARMEWPAWVEQQAAAGDEAAQSALRGMRYRDQRKKTLCRPGFEGEDLDGTLTPRQPDDEDKAPAGSIGGEVLPFRLSNAVLQIDYRHQRITYIDDLGQVRLTDSGPRIDVHQTDAGTISQGLLLAAQKFGGEVYITGDADFRERAARQAARTGIRELAGQRLSSLEANPAPKLSADFLWTFNVSVRWRCVATFHCNRL